MKTITLQDGVAMVPAGAAARAKLVTSPEPSKPTIARAASDATPFVGDAL
ncbi:hypothetical protein [Microvirga sp. TS319]